MKKSFGLCTTPSPESVHRRLNREKNRFALIGILGFFTLGLLLSGAVPALAQVQFSGPTNYPVGISPLGAAVGDFNGDGKQDLAVVNTGSANVSILLGNGDGTFQPAVNYSVGGSPGYVAVGDFNGDGKLDLAVSNGPVVNILLGNGDGTFRPPKDYKVHGLAYDVYVADFNGDGKSDLLTVNTRNGKISVLLGKGDGTFQAPIVTSTKGNIPYIAIGDFNGDGKQDVVIAESLRAHKGNRITLLGNGDGTFQPPQITPLNLSPRYLIAGDFNGDGKLDFAQEGWTYGCEEAICVSTMVMGVGLGNGDGTFRSGGGGEVAQYACWGGECTGATTAAIMAPADLNNDGKLDLIALAQGWPVGCGQSCPPPEPKIEAFLGNGDGTFQKAQLFSLATVPNWLALEDFNGDSLPDLAIINNSDNSVSIFLNESP